MNICVIYEAVSCVSHQHHRHIQSSVFRLAAPWPGDVRSALGEFLGTRPRDVAILGEASWHGAAMKIGRQLQQGMMGYYIYIYT